LALRRLRSELSERGLEARVAAPPELAPEGVRAVEAILRRRRATCLERSLIMQRWLMAHGEPYEVSIGVRGGAKQMEAHAWLDGYDPETHESDFQVLTHVAARA
jgi:Transglutaminase-like superfamily